MAIYEYYCPKCNDVFEVMRSMSKAAEPAICCKCGSQGRKLLSVFGSTADSSIKVPDKEPFRPKRKKL
jgi:putative FmdB family regulatory protein